MCFLLNLLLLNPPLEDCSAQYPYVRFFLTPSNQERKTRKSQQRKVEQPLKISQDRKKNRSLKPLKPPNKRHRPRDADDVSQLLRSATASFALQLAAGAIDVPLRPGAFSVTFGRCSKASDWGVKVMSLCFRTRHKALFLRKMNGNMNDSSIL